MLPSNDRRGSMPCSGSGLFGRFLRRFVPSSVGGRLACAVKRDPFLPMDVLVRVCGWRFVCGGGVVEEFQTTDGWISFDLKTDAVVGGKARLRFVYEWVGIGGEKKVRFVVFLRVVFLRVRLLVCVRFCENCDASVVFVVFEDVWELSGERRGRRTDGWRGGTGDDKAKPEACLRFWGADGVMRNVCNPCHKRTCKEREIASIHGAVRLLDSIVLSFFRSVCGGRAIFLWRVDRVHYKGGSFVKQGLFVAKGKRCVRWSAGGVLK